MKKAISIQFNWIFVLIAGAIILVFFGSLMMKQKEVSESASSVDTIIKLKNKLGVSGTELGKSEEISFQDKEVEITCNELSTGKTTRTLTEPVFAPRRLRGAKLITLTRAFNMPFHVTNIVYITTSSVRYVIVYDPAVEESKTLAEAIKEDMGEKVHTELVSKHVSITDSKYTKTRIIFVKIDSNRVQLSGEVSAIRIIDNTTVNFFKDNDMKNKGGSHYISKNLEEDRELILAAIFAEDKESYECGLKKIFKRLDILSTLYKDRADTLATLNALNPVCDYINATETLDKIKQKASQLSLNPSSSTDLLLLKEQIDILETENKAKIMESCPEVY